ncbi:phosphoenolpyruvate carboxykinase (ATP) [Falsibacillus albus]|uniref:Aldolase n=1 Tax=Falsibacillus albus TaxID=2478915 RepID=A0A3L7K2S7_9BACI|nr:aldolase [Falsibacillus albus]RLQ96291.1 aldolase [Falsibacillus albus]
MECGEKKYSYEAFGLKIMSDIKLPELNSLPGQDITEVKIERRNLKDYWQEDWNTLNRIMATENHVIFRIPELAVFRITNGNHIMFLPFEGADVNKIRLYLLGTCMGSILMQRKLLPLHGSAVDIKGKAYAFVGIPGAGKSTLATAFLQKGYKLLTDDVIALALSDEGPPNVIPAYPQQKLWDASLAAFEMNQNHYSPLFEREKKFAVPVKGQFSSESIPLAGIFELRKTDTNALTLQSIQGLEGLHMLFIHTYRNSLIQHLGLRSWHFKGTSNLSYHVPLYRIERPSNIFTANDIFLTILKTIEKENFNDYKAISNT